MQRFIAYFLIIQLSLQPFLVYFARAEASGAIPAVAATIAPPVAPVVPAAATVAPAVTPAVSASTTVAQGLSWLNESLSASIAQNGGSISAEVAANNLIQSGASQAQAEIVLNNQIAKGSVTPPVEPQGFWSKILSFGKQTGANAQMTVNKAGSVLDFKPYTDVELSSGSTLRWNNANNNSYQIISENGQVLNRSNVDASANVKNIKLEGPVDVEAFANYQGELAAARARIDISRAELSGLELKAQANQATSKDLARLSELKSNIPKYEEAYSSLEEQTKLASSPKNSIKEFTGNAAKFALTSVGIRAGINVLTQAVSGEGIDLGKAFSFMADTTFWTGTAGSFIGSTLFAAIGNAVLPGSGAIMQVLPSFLGAAVGYEIGSGNADRTNWTQLIASTAVSAAAFAMIGGPLGIGASILAGMLVNKFFDKDEGIAPPELEKYVPNWADFDEMSVPQAIPQAVTEMPIMQAPVQYEQVIEAPATPKKPKVAVDPNEIAKYNDDMALHYQKYIKAVKEKNASIAESEYQLYKEAKIKLETLRGF